MNCVSPPELNDSQLLAHLDGEAGPEVASHLARCAYCREKSEQLARWQNRLAARVYRVTCPSPLELGEYHLRLLDAEPAAMVTQHLNECPHCRLEVARLKDYVRELAPAPGAGRLAQVKVIVAQLVGGRDMGRLPGEGALTPALSGIRGGQDEPFIYRADGIQVAIEIQADVEQPDRKVILGLITGPDTSEISVRLWQADQLAAVASVDEFGNFTIAHLIPGEYALTLSGSQVEIHIQSLQV